MAPPPRRLTVLEASNELAEVFPARSNAVAELHRKARAALRDLGRLRALPVDALAVEDVQEWINALADRYAPATVAKYLGPVREALDHLQPNPARSGRLRLPRPAEDEVVDPPSWRTLQLILAGLSPPEHRLTCLFLERHGLRAREISSLTIGDLDLAGRRIRIARSRTKPAPAGSAGCPSSAAGRSSSSRRPAAA